MHPFALAPSRYNGRSAEIGEMARNFRLGQLQCLDQITDAHFIIAHEIYQSEPRPIGKRAKEQLHNVRFSLHRQRF